MRQVAASCFPFVSLLELHQPRAPRCGDKQPRSQGERECGKDGREGGRRLLFHQHFFLLLPDTHKSSKTGENQTFKRELPVLIDGIGLNGIVISTSLGDESQPWPIVWLTEKALLPSGSHNSSTALHLHRFCLAEEVGSVEITRNVNSVRQENNGSHSYRPLEVSPWRTTAGCAAHHPDLHLNV